MPFILFVHHHVTSMHALGLHSVVCEEESKLRHIIHHLYLIIRTRYVSLIHPSYLFLSFSYVVSGYQAFFWSIWASN